MGPALVNGTLKTFRFGFVVCFVLLLSPIQAKAVEYLPGFNIIQVPDVPLDHPNFPESLRAAQQTGARMVALIPFLWQATADSVDVGFGDAVSDAQIISGIREAHAAGMTVLIKPHIWVDRSWAGAIDPGSLTEWERWVSRYIDPIVHYAEIAEAEGVARFAIGTELVNLRSRDLWIRIIDAVRDVYSGEMTYVAQGAEGVLSFPAWDQLDVVSLSVYESLGLNQGPAELNRHVADAAERLVAAQAALDRPLAIAELGLMSAENAQVEPWLSPEERPAAEADHQIQALVLGLWTRELERLEREGRLELDSVLIWRWFSDPHAGGWDDVDFTVQNKLAVGVLACHWQAPACPPTLGPLMLTPPSSVLGGAPDIAEGTPEEVAAEARGEAAAEARAADRPATP